MGDWCVHRFVLNFFGGDWTDLMLLDIDTNVWISGRKCKWMTPNNTKINGNLALNLSSIGGLRLVQGLNRWGRVRWFRDRDPRIHRTLVPTRTGGAACGIAVWCGPAIGARNARFCRWCVARPWGIWWRGSFSCCSDALSMLDPCFIYGPSLFSSLDFIGMDSSANLVIFGNIGTYDQKRKWLFWCCLTSS